MKHLIALAQIIEEAGFGVSGQTLFVGTLPGDVARGIMIRPPLNAPEIDDGMEGHTDETIIIIIRDPDMLSGYNKALELMPVLRKQRLQVGDIYFTWMRPAERPVSYPRGDGDEIETSLRIQVGWIDTA